MNVSNITSFKGCDCNNGINFKPNTSFEVIVGSDVGIEGDHSATFPITPSVSVFGKDANGSVFHKSFEVSEDGCKNAQNLNKAVAALYAIEAYKAPEVDHSNDDIKYWNP